MNTNQAIEKMNERAESLGYEISQGIVYGNFSSRTEQGVKVQSVTRTYEASGKKLTLCYDASTDEIY